MKKLDMTPYQIFGLIRLLRQEYRLYRKYNRHDLLFRITFACDQYREALTVVRNIQKLNDSNDNVTIESNLIGEDLSYRICYNLGLCSITQKFSYTGGSSVTYEDDSGHFFWLTNKDYAAQAINDIAPHIHYVDKLSLFEKNIKESENAIKSVWDGAHRAAELKRKEGRYEKLTPEESAELRDLMKHPTYRAYALSQYAIDGLCSVLR